MSKPKLTDEDFCRAAKRIRCDVASVKAVAEVESRGSGFYANGFPTILFERHVFRKYTNSIYNRSHPHLSGPAGNYGKAGQNQRNKFNEAYALNPTAAIKACSWGKFQVMGFNWKVAGFSSVVDFFEAMQRSEGEHLNAFIGFVIGNRLDDEIRHKDWAGFAYGYNGAGYKANKYDTAMARSYAKFVRENIDCSNLSAANPVVNDTADHPVSDPTDAPAVEIQTDSPPNDIVPADQTQPSVTNTTVEKTITESVPGGETTTTTTAQSIAAPVEVQKETPSWMVKIAAPFTALAGIGINAGSFVQTKLEQMTVQQVVYMIAALGLVALAIYWWQRSAKAAQARTMQLVEKAADPNQTTVILTK